MATLQLEFNCLCMFVRDRAAGAVHVLMPSTHHLAHHGDHHVVRLIHPSLGREPQGRSMLGWALSLGPADGTADVTLRPGAGNGTVANLSAATGSTVDRALVEGPHERIASRVTLRAGRIVRADAEARWMLNGREVSIAHRVLWEMENVSETEPLPWASLGAAGAPPLRALEDLAPERSRAAAKRLYRVRVFHTTPAALPPNTRIGPLDPAAFARHFAVFYTLLGVPRPATRLLPVLPEEPLAAAGRHGALVAAMGGALGLGWWGRARLGDGEAAETAVDRRRFVIRGGLALGGMLLFGGSADAGAETNGTAIGKFNCGVGGGELHPAHPSDANGAAGDLVHCGVGGGELAPQGLAGKTVNCGVGGGDLRQG